MPSALGWTILALAFLDEVLLVAAAWVAAATWGGWPAGAVAAAVVVAAWATFASPKAPLGGPVTRPVTQVAVVAVACGSLVATGYPSAGLALLAFSVVINGLAMLPSVARLADVSPARGEVRPTDPGTPGSPDS